MDLETKEGKEKFIRDYMKNLTDDMIKRIDHVPENWDGFELRQWVYDCAEPIKMDKKRKREYNNDLMINPNLRW